MIHASHDKRTKLVLSLQDLQKSFGALKVTQQLNLDVSKNEIHALIGPNGAGKTSLINQIAGALTPDSGQIWFNGNDITHQAAHVRVRHGLARSFQITTLAQGLTVGEHLALAARAKLGFGESMWRFKGSPVNTKTNIASTMHIMSQTLASVGLESHEHTPIHALSHGDERALEIGLALALSPDMLLLDEPLAGTGAHEAEALIKLISSLRDRHTILLIEHDMEAVFTLADRISVLVEGRIIITDTPERVRQNFDVQAAYLGTDA